LLLFRISSQKTPSTMEVSHVPATASKRTSADDNRVLNPIKSVLVKLSFEASPFEVGFLRRGAAAIGANGIELERAAPG
jgi:hypothetical protein